MSKIISKNGITVGEISAKQNNVKNETVIVFKVFHGSEEDIFIFHYNKLLQDWILDLQLSLVSLSKMSNQRLIEEVYCHFKPTKSINVQEFTDLLLEHHFHIFIETNKETSKKKYSMIGFFDWLFKRNK